MLIYVHNYIYNKTILEKKEVNYECNETKKRKNIVNRKIQ
jgi:hypothetical protein